MAVRIFRETRDAWFCTVLDLGLPNTTEGMRQERNVRETQARFQIRGLPHVCFLHGSDYMLVGANLFYEKQAGQLMLSWTPVTEDTGFIKLPCENQDVIAVMELFAGGMSAWSQACDHLPVQVTQAVDAKHLAVQSLQLNAIVRSDRCGQGHPTHEVRSPDVGDLRVLSTMDVEEGFLASPPCQGFSNLGKG